MHNGTLLKSIMYILGFPRSTNENGRCEEKNRRRRTAKESTGGGLFSVNFCVDVLCTLKFIIKDINFNVFVLLRAEGITAILIFIF